MHDTQHPMTAVLLHLISSLSLEDQNQVIQELRTITKTRRRDEANDLVTKAEHIKTSIAEL